MRLVSGSDVSAHCFYISVLSSTDAISAKEMAQLLEKLASQGKWWPWKPVEKMLKDPKDVLSPKVRAKDGNKKDKS